MTQTNLPNYKLRSEIFMVLFAALASVTTYFALRTLELRSELQHQQTILQYRQNLREWELEISSAELKACKMDQDILKRITQGQHTSD